MNFNSRAILNWHFDLKQRSTVLTKVSTTGCTKWQRSGNLENRYQNFPTLKNHIKVWEFCRLQGVNQQVTKSKPKCDTDAILFIPQKYTQLSHSPWHQHWLVPDKDLILQGVLIHWKVYIITFSENQNAKDITTAIKYERFTFYSMDPIVRNSLNSKTMWL